MRKALHLRVGAKIILCLNFLWDVSAVPLGLMNGARGIIVAISYAEGRRQSGRVSIGRSRVPAVLK